MKDIGWAIIIGIIVSIGTYFLGFAIAKETYTQPFYITLESNDCGIPKISDERYEIDFIKRDTTIHKGIVFAPVTFYYSYKIYPLNYYKDGNN